jgi:hypothetical protein
LIWMNASQSARFHVLGQSAPLLNDVLPIWDLAKPQSWIVILWYSLKQLQIFSLHVFQFMYLLRVRNILQTMFYTQWGRFMLNRAASRIQVHHHVVVSGPSGRILSPSLKVMTEPHFKTSSKSEKKPTIGLCQPCCSGIMNRFLLKRPESCCPVSLPQTSQSQQPVTTHVPWRAWAKWSLSSMVC